MHEWMLENIKEYILPEVYQFLNFYTFFILHFPVGYLLYCYLFPKALTVAWGVQNVVRYIENIMHPQSSINVRHTKLIKILFTYISFFKEIVCCFWWPYFWKTMSEWEVCHAIKLTTTVFSSIYLIYTIKRN